MIPITEIHPMLVQLPHRHMAGCTSHSRSRPAEVLMLITHSVFSDFQKYSGNSYNLCMFIYTNITQVMHDCILLRR